MDKKHFMILLLQGYIVQENCLKKLEILRAIDYMESKNLLGDNYDELKGMIEIEK